MKHLKYYLPYATAFILISGICGLVYAAVQQDLRQTANDPQIQIAEDGVAALQAGKQPLFSGDKIDLAKSLDTYVIIVDKDGKPISSNAQLDGKTPEPPVGIFQTAKQRTQYQVTWQPKLGVRQALVVVAVNNQAGQFIITGRSLREVEKREQQILLISAATWVIMLAVSFGAIYLYNKS